MRAKGKQQEVPANVAAEKAILGALILDNELIEATKSLEADDFYLESHRMIYQHITEMHGRGEAVDLVTLVEDMRQAKTLERVGESPVAYISDLSTETMRYRPAVREWAKIVKAKSLQRKLITTCTSAADKAFSGESGFDIINAIREQLKEIECSARKGI
jgi:replicative DNA helicase